MAEGLFKPGLGITWATEQNPVSNKVYCVQEILGDFFFFLSCSATLTQALMRARQVLNIPS